MRSRNLLLAWLILIVAAAQAPSQDFLLKAVYDPPTTKLDRAKEIVKLSAFAAGYADARTTTNAIRRGCVEDNRVANALIPLDHPAPAGRIALSLGANYAGNVALDYLYKKSENKVYRIFLLAARSVSIGIQTKFAIENHNLARGPR